MSMLLSGLLYISLLNPAHASAVAGCTFTGTVQSVQADRLTIRVAGGEPFGHSGPPPECPAAGSVVEFVPDSRDALAGLVAGSSVTATEVTVWNLTAKGASVSSTRTVAKVAPAGVAPAPLPTPE